MRSANCQISLQWRAVASALLLLTASAAIGGAPDYYYPDPNISTNGVVRVVYFYNGTLYVGGNFTKVTDENGTYNRTDIAAFDMSTRHVTQFRANTNSGTVRAIVAGNGRIYVGGSFTKINNASCSKVAALDPASGTAVAGFRENGGTISGSVWSLALSDTFLYIGGSFTSIDGYARTDLASVDKDSGAVNPGFNPAPCEPFDDSGKTDPGILALKVHPKNPEIIFVGGNFQTINGSSDRQFLVALKSDGTFGPDFSSPPGAAIKALDVNDSTVYAAVTGFYNRINAYDIGGNRYTRQWRGMRAQGDAQAVAYAKQGYVYFGFHDGLFDSTDDYRMASLNANTGAVYDAYPPMNSFIGVLALGASDSLLAVGGEFTRMNGRTQRYLAVFKIPSYVASVPATPALLEPADAEIVDVSPLLQWNFARYSTTYELQMFTDSQCLNPVVYRRGLTDFYYRCDGLDNAARYWWRVRAVNAIGASAWSFVWRFNTIPGNNDIPMIAYPTNGEIFQSLDGDLGWYATRSALAYGILVSETEDFSRIILDRDITDTSLHVSGLANLKKYYWAVTAITVGGPSEWAYANFQTDIPGPKAPRCLAPVNNASKVGSQTALSWTRAKGAVSYNVEVAADRPFQNVLYQASGLTDTSFAVTGLAEDTWYFWRVNAVNEGGHAWSLIMQFNTVFPFPSIPCPVFPASGYLAKADSLHLIWNKSKPHVMKYWVEIAHDSSMREVFIDSTALDTESIRIHLENNREFWWRVRAYNENGWSAYSEKRLFKTAFPVPAARVYKFALDKFALSRSRGSIVYSVAYECDVRLALFDLRGKTVWKVVHKNRGPGSYRENLSSSSFPVGNYFLSLKAGNFAKTADASLVR